MGSATVHCAAKHRTYRSSIALGLALALLAICPAAEAAPPSYPVQIPGPVVEAVPPPVQIPGAAKPAAKFPIQVPGPQQTEPIFTSATYNTQLGQWVAAEQHHSVKLIFMGEHGVYLRNLGVTITDLNNKPVIDTLACDSVLLLDLAPGTYHVHITYENILDSRNITASADSLKSYEIRLPTPGSATSGPPTYAPAPTPWHDLLDSLHLENVHLVKPKPAPHCPAA